MLTALGSPAELDVVAITTVAGNVPLARTTTPAMVELPGRPDVPVHAGCRRPMVRPLVTAEYVHGPTGIDGADLPDPPCRSPGHAVDAIVEILLRAPARHGHGVPGRTAHQPRDGDGEGARIVPRTSTRSC